MAAYRTHIATWTTSNGSKNATIAAVGGDLLVAFVSHQVNTSSHAVTDASGGTWTLAVGPIADAIGTGRCSVWIRDQSVASAGNIVVSTAPGTTSGGGLVVYAVSGMTRFGPAAIRSSGTQATIAAATPAPVLSLTPRLQSVVLAFVQTATNGSANCVPRSSPAYTERADQGYATPDSGIETSSIDSAETSATITHGGATPSAFSSIAIELDATDPSRYTKPKPQLGGLKGRRKGPPVLKTQRFADYGDLQFSNLGQSAVPDFDSGGAGTKFYSASWTPPTTGLIYLWVLNEITTGFPVLPTISGNGIDWVNVGTYTALTRRRLTLFAADATGSSTDITTFDFGTESQNYMHAMYGLVTGADLTGGVKAAFPQTATGTGTGTSGTVTLAAAKNPRNRPISSWFTSSGAGLEPRAAWTEQDELASTTESQFRADAFETTASSSYPSSKNWMGLAAEVKALEVPAGNIGPVPAGVPHKLALGMGIGHKRQGPPILVRQRLNTPLPPIPVAVDAALTATVEVVRITGKVIAAAMTGTAAVVRIAGKVIALAMTGTPVVVRSVGKPIAAALTGTAVVVRQTLKPIAATLTGTVAVTMSHTFNIVVAAVMTGTVAVVRVTGKVIAYAMTGTVAVVRITGKLIAYALTGTVAIARITGKVIAVAMTGTVAVTMSHTFNIVVAAVMTGTVAVVRVTGKVIDYTMTGTVAVGRSIGKVIAAALTGTVGVVRQTLKPIVVALTGTVAVVRVTNKIIEAAMTATASIVKRIGKTISVGLVAILQAIGFLPAPPTTGWVTWAEFETPDTPSRKGIVLWTDLELHSLWNDTTDPRTTQGPRYKMGTSGAPRGVTGG